MNQKVLRLMKRGQKRYSLVVMGRLFLWSISQRDFYPHNLVSTATQQQICNLTTFAVL